MYLFHAVWDMLTLAASSSTNILLVVSEANSMYIWGFFYFLGDLNTVFAIRTTSLQVLLKITLKMTVC